MSEEKEISKEKTWADQHFEWYRNPIIHFPLWIIFAFKYFDLIKTSEDPEGYFMIGIFLGITGLWGMISKMFFLRVPYLGTFIYENGYIMQANIVLILLGGIMCGGSILIYGTVVINNVIDTLMII